jgi:hypothetical protein
MSQRHTTHFEESKGMCALKIKNAKMDDSGVYTVLVENQFGSDDSSGQLFVISPDGSQQMPKTPTSAAPKFSQADEFQQIVPPRIIKHFQSESFVNEGQNVLLSAMVEGFPTPEVS